MKDDIVPDTVRGTEKSSSKRPGIDCQCRAALHTDSTFTRGRIDMRKNGFSEMNAQAAALFSV
jgi:hypothetical protein